MLYNTSAKLKPAAVIVNWHHVVTLLWNFLDLQAISQHCLVTSCRWFKAFCQLQPPFHALHFSFHASFTTHLALFPGSCLRWGAQSSLLHQLMSLMLHHHLWLIWKYDCDMTGISAATSLTFWLLEKSQMTFQPKVSIYCWLKSPFYCNKMYLSRCTILVL